MEHTPGGGVEEWYSEADGTIHRKTRQPVEGIKRAVHEMSDHARGKSQYYLGSIPVVIANQWSKECGAAIGTREFAEFAKRKLMDSDWRNLSTGIKA